MSTSTIAAIGTALSNSGISIIRISGDKSLAIIQKIFKTKHSLQPNSIVYGKIMEKDCVIDTVLVSYFKTPFSFTGEDVCEINCHGGIQITRQILEIVLKHGAVLAAPGEFSKRAFLNGKMDLSQAESVIDLIESKTRVQSHIAARQLEGELSLKVRSLREELVELLAQIEVSVDYPEYDYEEVHNENVIEILDRKIQVLSKMMDTYEQGKYIKNGVNVAILGKPNVGKSSLLNTLAKYEKAIVTDIPGTTRDIVEETINIGDLILNISDTAGIRDTQDVIEKIGVEKSLQILDEVDLVLYLLSGEEKIQSSDWEMLSKIQNKGLKFIIVINKMDKVEKSIFDGVLDQLKQNGFQDAISISAYTEQGVDVLKNRILHVFNEHDLDYEQELIIFNERHKELLKHAVSYLQTAKQEVLKNMPIDIISIYVKKATKCLGEMIGSDVSQDVVDKIFEKFCLGK